ncbi:hypothetical protein RDWZM_009295 [Blomia tropicalis]|uniref:Poly(A) RNA polymerase mitochondrial-like central palm domain-containing protein n=1 Tax=Blomia tropicalis TaxID=40697 RepID=A0A9Q0RJL2_BLOTA|nr:hypothetical protein RDWZM_009295 [Blomia tropicalis]
MQNTASLGYLQKHLEYVYFNEDLLNCLHKILNLKTIEQINGSDELSQVINFRCMIYNNDILFLDLLIRHDGQADGTIHLSSRPISMKSGSQTSRGSIPNKTKVFDQSIIYLFKEMNNLNRHIHEKTLDIDEMNTPTVEEQEEEEEVDNCGAIEQLSDNKINEVNEEDVGSTEIELTSTQPNLESLPHTASTFSISSDSDGGTLNDLHKFDDDSYLSTDDMGYWTIRDNSSDNVEQRLSRYNETIQQVSKMKQTFSRSMTTIYSDVASDENDDQDDDERQLSKCLSQCTLNKEDNKQMEDNQSTTNDNDENLFEDPYENLESLQAQERSLGENNVVYTQTIEIISEEEFDAESSQRDNHTNKTKQDTLSKLLDNLPLNDINQTIQYIRKKLLLNKEDIQKRKQLVRKMEKVLCEHGFNCELFIFGSTKNWLGMATSSDIDIFIQLKDSRGRSIDETHISYGKIEHVLHRIHRILVNDQKYLEVLSPNNRHPRNNNYNDNMNVIIQTICHRHMRVPITRMKIYSKSQRLLPISGTGSLNSSIPLCNQILQCDFNVNNALGIANTRLIRFLCKFEPRFFALNVLLRYWGKSVSMLIKPDCLSSYALTNLILFFFQMRKPQILPSVDYFVKLSDKPEIVNDWRCDFCSDKSKIDFCTQNTESIMQLCVGFFRYYNNFNFLQFKISTRYARAWRLRNNRMKRHNRNGGNGETMSSNRRDHHIDRHPLVHIMDPFEQSHNLTARMRSQMFDRLCYEFNQAAERYEKYL